MTTSSSESLDVLGVLVDTAYLYQQKVLVSTTVDEVVQRLWRTVSERADEATTSETPHPSVVQVLLGEISTFLTSKS